MATTYPLEWPAGWPRTGRRTGAGARFAYITIHQAVNKVRNEFRLAGVDDWNIVISSNLELRNDGFPRSNQPKAMDPGVAIYFRRSGRQLVMASDHWDDAASNINAVALAIDGMRKMERHGGAVMVERAFAGFEALPPPVHNKPWRGVLQPGTSAIIETFTDAKRAYRRRALDLHPDRGGTAEQWAELTSAWEAAKREFG